MARVGSPLPRAPFLSLCSSELDVMRQPGPFFLSARTKVYHAILVKVLGKTSNTTFDYLCDRLEIERSGNGTTDECKAGDQSSSSEIASSSEMPQVNENFMDCPEFPVKEVEVEPKPATSSENVETNNNGQEQGDLQYTDVYLSEKSESDDEASVVVSDYCIPEVLENESHYITTHEIQLSELDHDVDCDFGMGSSWDIDDDHQVYSFVDYASFDSDETIGREYSVSANVKSNRAEANTSEAAVSTKPESDLCDTNKHASSDEKLPNNQNGAGNTAGQIHLSIKTTSRAIKEPSNVQEKENVLYHTSHTKETSRRYGWHDTKDDKMHDGAKCLIAVPGRLHFGNKLKGKDNEYSSGASSAVSDLDDADKEVRNLTARAFKSLAYPYFDAINFSTSSESSASEHGRGINRWSKFVDLKYGNMNVSARGDRNTVSHKSSSTNVQLARKRDRKGMTGLSLTSMRAPPVEIFALNGSLFNQKNAPTKKIELLGNFREEQSGVIRLTETLNLCCNVKAGPPGNERRAQYAQNTGGSPSIDEVTNTLPSGQGSESGERPCNAGETMEDTHKKAVFASNLLKNVISKKMQFEQERKMERGEICEPNHTPSPNFTSHDHEPAKERVTSKDSRGLQRQTSRFSEPDSDFTIVCLDELGDIVDSNSCSAKDDSHREETLTLASEPNLVSSNEAGFDTKKGAFEPSKSTLLRSQNSAFRSWRDGELEFQKERKNDKSPERKPQLTNDKRGESELGSDSMDHKMTKMSHLFVPSIQLLSSEKDVGKPQPDVNCTVRAAVDRKEIGGMQLRADDTLYVSDAARSIVTSKSPEIKIRLRSVRENKSDPFSIAKMLTPNIGCGAGNLIKAGEDSKCQALAAALKTDSSDKVPQFMVRDIRDNKGKLQPPIHQVRDVRKLVKSSYHFVSLDNNENKSNSADGEHKTSKRNAYRNPASLSQIVIKCQSVNTNSNVKQSGNLMEPSKHKFAEDIPEPDRSSPQGAVEGNKSGTTHIHKQTGRMPLATTKQEGSSGLRTETSTGTKKQDKVSDTGEKKADSKMAALEKLQAAVKTMEQLYVFDKYEWKRKTEPQPITDSHVLSLIASEEHEGTDEELGNTGSVFTPAATTRRDSITSKTPPSGQQFTQTERPLTKEEKEMFKTSHTPVVQEEQNGPKPLELLGGTPNKNISCLSDSQKYSAPITASSVKTPQMNVSSPASLGSKGMAPKSPKLPVSLKITQPKHTVEESQKPSDTEAVFASVQFTSLADSENYLTIPVKPHTTSPKQPAKSICDKTAVYTFPAQASKTQTISLLSHLGHSSDTKSDRESHQSPKRSSIVMETQSPDTPTATIYHHSLPITMQAAQPQVICFSPAVQPSPVPTEHFQTTQRKMLLDPTTGSYYLVDTPVQPATRRLFDPETGQYVDVPMSQQSPVTPVPMPISPLAISPGAYSHTYMFYPGYMPTTVIPARTIQSQLSMQTEVEGQDKAHFQTGQHSDGAYMESPYYVPSGKSQNTAPGAQHIITGRAIKCKQPVISISSQQGPRIVAPPSFDGTTMSFVFPFIKGIEIRLPASFLMQW
ncbi:hypothetical protein P4O66_000902 [Electrophorus voltai]|uniref:DUF4585 domain-containing protein n=1 Tax=Electrophorus voltai TaxID=2609070 RepID=A0AAD8ZF66_9TELE|nr:hypothetical protein P4O66_000902 [Electrophorus voltai]